MTCSPASGAQGGCRLGRYWSALLAKLATFDDLDAADTLEPLVSNSNSTNKLRCDSPCNDAGRLLHYQLGNERTGWLLPAHPQVGAPGGLSVSTREAWPLTDRSGTQRARLVGWLGITRLAGSTPHLITKSAHG